MGKAEADVLGLRDTLAACQAEIQPSCGDLPQGQPVGARAWVQRFESPTSSHRWTLLTREGSCPALRPSPAATPHLHPSSTPGLSCPHSCFSQWGDGLVRTTQSGQSYCSGQPQGRGSRYLHMDRVDGTRASTGRRQLPGTHQHRSFWGVSCVHRAHLTPTPRPHPAPRCPIALHRPIRGKASGGV